MGSSRKLGQAKLKNFKIFMDNTLCHHYKGTVGFGQTVDIRCDTPVVGRYLKIQLMDSSTVLTLCEVTIQAFQYRACSNKYYGPNCNNRCQCANDVTCDDKTGLCPSGYCNDLFTGPYCNIAIPSVSKNGSSSPTSISVKWQYIIHDSAYDAGKVVQLDLRYQKYMSPSSSSRSTRVTYGYSSPRPGTFSANVTNLKPSTRYSFHIRLIHHSLKTDVASGPTAIFQTESCTGYMVMPVITVRQNTIHTGYAWPNRAYLGINAKVPGMIAGCKKELDVYIKKTNETNYVQLTKADQIYPIRRLTAFTEYDIKATVRSPDGYEKDSNQKIKTPEDVPSAPTIAKAGASPSSVSIRITPPDPPYGIITEYDIEMWEAGNGLMTYIIYSYGPTKLTHTFNKLKLNTTYNFKARAFTSYGSGEWTSVIRKAAVENIPGPPNTLLAQEHTTTSLALFWTKPIYPNGILKNYKVICIPLFSYDDEVDRDRTKYTKQSNPDPDEKVLTVFRLTPATEYNCSVAAQTSKGYGPSIWLRNWTKPEEAVVPDDLFLRITPGKTTDSTITVEVPNMPKSLKTGSISKVRIAVERQETRRRRSTPLLEEDQDNLTDHATANEKGYPGYIAAELAANFSGPFVIGDGKMYGGYDNPPLTKRQKYDVFFGMVLAVGRVTTIVYRRYEQSITVEGARANHKVGLGVGLAGGVLVVLAVVIVLVIMWRKRREKNEAAESIDIQLHSITRPTTMSEVEQVKRKVSDNKTDRHTHPTGEDAARATATLQTPDNAHDSVYMNVDNRAFENAEESAYIEIENPYEGLNITPDVIADQVYAEIKPLAFSRADC